MAHPDPEASHCQWDPSALEAMSPIPASPVLPMYHSRFPKPWTFGVIRMNPVAMVEGLNDPVALAAAREMVTQKYLVYFHMHLDLPTPESRWCRYLIYPVAATLRPEFPPLGIASDMVMPIAPNEENRKNRHPITPIPTLPFKNCYFWYESELPVRVRRSPDSYCPKWAAELSPKDCSELGRMWETEFPRLEEAFEGLSQEEIKALKEKGSHTVLPPLPYPPTEMSLEVIPACDSPGVLDTDCELPVPYPDSDSEEACGETSSFVGSLASFVGDVFEMNILGWEADPASKFLPLVDMWLEVDEHLSEDTIPSPIDLYDEQRAIQRIMIDALDRRCVAVDPEPFLSLPGAIMSDATEAALTEADVPDDARVVEHIFPSNERPASGAVSYAA